MRKGISVFHLDHSRSNTITRAEFLAKNKQSGMDLEELDHAVRALQAQPGCSKLGYRVKVSLGWKQQIQSIAFEEKEDVPKTA